MMCTWRFPFVITLLSLLVAPLAVQADDLAPPPWRAAGVTLPHSYMAKFNMEQFQGIPMGPTIETIGPSAPYILDPTISAEVDILSNQNPLVYLVTLPNFIDPLPLKRVRVQYSWYTGVDDPTTNPGYPGDAQTLNIIPHDSTGVASYAPVFSSPTTIFSPDPDDPLRTVGHRYDDFEIRPNPDWETFEIAFFSDPRWIIIDTISIPEPASVLLVVGLIGCAGVVRSRR
ncbi:PEP-CTERM sorting domain-containing protein [Rubripirellula amarantea]|nr:PEP-CTERM sorting domain-containing protein [Rubripirellula amarantea]